MKHLHLIAMPAGITALLLSGMLLPGTAPERTFDAGTATPVQANDERWTDSLNYWRDLPAPNFADMYRAFDPDHNDMPITLLRLDITCRLPEECGSRVWLCGGMQVPEAIPPEATEAELASEEAARRDSILAYLHACLSPELADGPKSASVQSTQRLRRSKAKADWVDATVADATDTDATAADATDARHYGIYARPVDTAETGVRTWLQQQTDTMAGMDLGIQARMHGDKALTADELLRLLDELRQAVEGGGAAPETRQQEQQP